MRAAIVMWLTVALAASAQSNTGSGGRTGSSSSSGNFGGGSSTSGAGSNQSLLGGLNTPQQGTGGTSGAVSPTNLLAPYYSNPYAAGLPSGASSNSFGVPVFNMAGGSMGGMSTGNRGTTTNRGTSGLGNASGSGLNSASRTSGSSLGSSFGSSFGSSSTGRTGSSFGSGTSTIGGSGLTGGTGGLNSGTGMNRGTTGTGLNNMGMNSGMTNLGGLNSGRTGGLAGLGNNNNNLAANNSTGLKPGLLYSTTPRFGVAPITPNRVQVEVQTAIGRSTSIRVPTGVQVVAVPQGVILRGTVADEDERRHIENLVRLSPGVRDVQNELQIR